jgi:metacaspase-1
MKRLIVGILVAVLVLVLIAPAVLAKPDMGKPLPATDVELVKKITIHGKPGGGGKGKPATPAATGNLSANCSGTKYAIVVGISDYPGTANDLQYCDEDARDMVSALISLYGYNETNIISLIDEESTNASTLNASFNNIHNAVNDIKERMATDPSPEQDEVVFFFSGHGANGKWPYDNAQDKLQGVDSNGIDEAIVCHDGSQNGQFMYIWDGQLRDWFADFDTSRIIFIFDSCLAGGMTDLQAPGRVINMACSETGVSYEASSWGGGHGQFTYYFVDQGMLSGLAGKYDYNGDGIYYQPQDVSVEEAFDYAKANCQVQKPTISDSFSNDLLL